MVFRVLRDFFAQPVREKPPRKLQAQTTFSYYLHIPPLTLFFREMCVFVGGARKSNFWAFSLAADLLSLRDYRLGGQVRSVQPRNLGGGEAGHSGNESGVEIFLFRRIDRQSVFGKESSFTLLDFLRSTLDGKQRQDIF